MAEAHPTFEGFADRYTIERELGRGGMATVYLARDHKYDRQVALKVLHPHLAAVLGADRFLREIRLTAQLQHPHILPLLDSGEAVGFLYYAMPCVTGESLRQRLERSGPLPLEEAVAIARTVAAALDYAHEAGVVHRDIKPENILMHQGEAMVADFGIALAVSHAGGDRMTGTGISLGTPAYMSPEQAAAEELDRRTDVYSLGCVLYELLAGQPPFTGTSAQAVIAQSLSAPVPRLSSVRQVPAAVEQAITRALAKDRDARFPTAGAFAAALTTPARPARRIPRQAIVAGALLAVIGVGVALRPHLDFDRAAPGVAVLYFDNLSPDSADAYLADGLTEEIIARLGGVSRLSVQSRAAVKRFRGNRAAQDPAEIARALGVTYLVTGSVRGSGPRARVTVELVKASSGARVWGTTFDRPVGDALDMEDDIAQAVAQGVVGRLATTERAALTARATENREAYDHYLKGNWYLARRGSEADGRRALEEYQAALRLDPGFASAYGRLGLVYGIYANWPWEYPGFTLDSLVGRGLAAADRALALDSSNVDGLLARGFLLIPYLSDADGQRAFFLDPSLLSAGIALRCPPGTSDCAHQAVTVLARAVRLAPRDPEVWYQYGRAQHVAARGDSALLAAGDTSIQVAFTLEPDSKVAAWLLGFTNVRRRRWEAASRMLDSAIALGRRDPSVYSLRLHTRLARGDTAGARADLDTIARFLAAHPPQDPLSRLYLTAMRAVVAARAGDSAAARIRLREILDRHAAHPLSTRTETLCLAAAYLAAGQRDRAVALLARLPESRWDRLLNPLWDPIRPDLARSRKGEDSPAPASREGYLQTPGGRVWYRVVGGGPRTPLLVLHGGPGVPSLYLKPLAALGDERPVVFYDQLGAGKSDHPADSTLWNMEHYLDELTRLRDALGLKDIHLLGHSWGSIIAIDYALTRPAGLRSLVLAGPVIDARRQRHDRDSLFGTLPESPAAALRREPPDAPHHTAEWQAARLEFLRRYFARRQPWSAEMDSGLGKQDFTAARAMRVFLENYDRTDRLHEITLPTLIAVGRYDTSRPETVREYGQRIPGSLLVVFDSSGHLPMQDEPERYVQVLRRFLHDADARPRE